MNIASSKKKTQWIVAVVLVFTQVLTCSFIHSEDFWRLHFFETGVTAFFYQVSRLILFTLLLLWPVTLGRILARRFFSFSRHKTADLELVLHSFFLGSAALNLLGAVMAILGLLSWPLLLFLSIVLSALIPFILIDDFFSLKKEWRTLRKSKAQVAAYCLVFIEVGYLLLAKGFPPDRDAGDTLGHYLPFLQSVVDQGKLSWPTPFYIDLFFLKGMGFTLSAASLTDINVTQLISYAFYLMAGGVLLFWLRRAFQKTNPLFVPFVMFCYFSSSLIRGMEFQKMHVMSGAFLLYLMLAIGRWSHFVKEKRYLPMVLFITSAFALMNPPYMIFVGILLFVEGLLCLKPFDRPRLTQLSVIAATVLLSVAFLLSANYLFTGIAEITPFSSVLKLSSSARRPAGILLWYVRYVSLEGGTRAGSLLSAGGGDHFKSLWGILSEGLLGEAHSAITAIFALLGLVVATIFTVRRLSSRKELLRQFWMTVAFLLVLFITKGIVTQTSFVRGLTFLSALQCFFWATIAITLKQALPRSAPGKFGGYLWMLLLLPLLWMGTVRLWDLGQYSLDLATGRLSFGEYYGFSLSDPCIEARSKIQPTERLTLLHVIATCVGNPVARVDYPDPQNFMDGAEPIFTEEPHLARKAFEKLGVNHFLLIPGESMYFFAAMPVFQPDFVRENLKFETKLRNGYLLTWRKEGEAPLSEGLLEIYRKAVANPQNATAKAFFQEWVRRRNEGER